MARPLRIQRTGCWYHITARGNERRQIFIDDKDRRHFLELRGAAVGMFRLRLRASVLMFQPLSFADRDLALYLGRTVCGMSFRELSEPVRIEYSSAAGVDATVFPASCQGRRNRYTDQARRATNR